MLRNEYTMNQANISVIIPSFNRTMFLTQAVQSVINQQVRVKEIIIIDNGSDLAHESELLRIRNLHESISLIRLPFNKGPGYARNLGISRSSGEWILFLDDDDVLSPDYMDTCLECVRSEDQAEMILTRAVCFKKGHRVSYPRDAIGAVNLAAYKKEDRVTAMLLNTITVGSCLVRRDVIGSLRFREDIWHGEDTLFWFLLMREIKILAINDRAFAGVRQHPDKLSRKKDACNPDGSPILSKETYVRIMLNSMQERNSWNEFTLKVICQRVADDSWYSPSMMALLLKSPLYGARIMTMLVKKRLYRYKVMLNEKIVSGKPLDFTWLPDQ